MFQIVIGPDAIERKGVDSISKVAARAFRESHSPYGELIFLTGIRETHILAILRRVLKVADMAMSICTRIDPENLPKMLGRAGDVLRWDGK